MEKVIVFGAGNCGRLIGSALYHEGKEIVCFIDNDPLKEGKNVILDTTLSGGGGIPIYPATRIMTLAFDRIVVGTFTGLYEIADQLRGMGICEQKIDVSYIELSVKAREAFVKDFAKEVYDREMHGSVAEVGVYRGDFARVINEAFADRNLYLFDTFEGFSVQDLKQDRDGTMGKNLGQRHFSNTSIELVLAKMPHKDKCIIKKGWFPQSAQDLEEDKFCFVNLDCDLYEPILAGLEFFYPKMVRGGVILIHEYFSQGYVGVKEAVNEFLKNHNLGSAFKVPIGDHLSIAIIKLV